MSYHACQEGFQHSAWIPCFRSEMLWIKLPKGGLVVTDEHESINTHYRIRSTNTHFEVNEGRIDDKTDGLHEGQCMIGERITVMQNSSFVKPSVWSGENTGSYPGCYVFVS